MSETARPRMVGRYALYAQIASGGMASVHLGRLLGPVGFTRLCAIKRLHPHVSRDPAFVAMFLDEARVAARIRHPNVIQTLDIVAEDRDLFLVMEYIEGESLARLLTILGKREERAPPARIAASILHGALAGLAAAHEARDEHGRSLGVVHRDVSPQNILVGVDGVPRVLDFGIAKAMGRLSTTQTGQLKGKLPYMAPEQIRSQAVSPRTDIWGASVVLWEALTGSRLFTGSEREIISQVFDGEIPPPSSVEPSVPPSLDAVTEKGLQRDPSARYASARDMARALERAIEIAPASEISEWISGIAGETLAKRSALVHEAEASELLESEEASEPSEPDPTPIASAPATPPLPEPLPPTAARPIGIGRALVPLIVGILLGGAVVGTVMLTGRSRKSVTSAAPPVSTEHDSPPALGSEAIIDPTPAADPTVFELPPDWTPDAGVRQTGEKAARRVSNLAPSSSGAKPVSDCEPAYYYEKGIKKYKPQCLRH